MRLKKVTKFENKPELKIEDLTGFHIWCFTCKETVFSKETAKLHHLNHEVDYVRRHDGKRYSHISDKEIPIKK